MLVKIQRDCRPSGPVAYIKVGDRTAVIDAEDYDRISAYAWHLRYCRFQVYAVRKKRTNGREFLVHMHRQIMHTPTGNVVHHKNHCGLDNRKSNLENMSPEAHKVIHMFW